MIQRASANPVRACPVCDATSSVQLDERPRAPVLMHRVFTTQQEATACAVGHVDLRRCTSCGFAWNASFDDARMTYDPGYDNCQSHSSTFRAHVATCAKAVAAARADLKTIEVVEVGAGQGDFLKAMAEAGAHRLKRLTGYDPAWRGEDGAAIQVAAERIGGPVTMYRTYFSASAVAATGAAPDVVVSRHTIEHVADPLAFLRAIRAAIGTREGVEVFIETPDIEWIVEHQAFEDVFYEHCSLFDPASLELALERSGFTNVSVEHRFGRQYLWASAVSTNTKQSDDAAPPKRAPVSTRTIATDDIVRDWQTRIARIEHDGGRVVVWGAGAKGMTFAQIVDPSATKIAALVDINPGKQGRHIGVSAHRVVAPEELPGLVPTHAIVMNPVYTAEIADDLARRGLHVALLPIQ